MKSRRIEFFLTSRFWKQGVFGFIFQIWVEKVLNSRTIVLSSRQPQDPSLEKGEMRKKSTSIVIKFFHSLDYHNVYADREVIALHDSRLSESIGILYLIDYFDCCLSLGLSRRGENILDPKLNNKNRSITKVFPSALELHGKQSAGCISRRHFWVKSSQMFSHAFIFTIKMVIRVVAGPTYKKIEHLLWLHESKKPHPMTERTKQKKTHIFINFVLRCCRCR